MEFKTNVIMLLAIFLIMTNVTITAAEDSDGFIYPVDCDNVGNKEGEKTCWRDLQNFGSLNYEVYPPPHLGEDWNWGTGVEDLGEPVYAISNGIIKNIIDTTSTSDGWGKAIILEHKAPSGKQFILGTGGSVDTVYSMYAHILKIEIIDEKGNIIQLEDIIEGETEVKKGWKIAEVGTGNGQYPTAAHLHFEIRTDIIDFSQGRGRGYSWDMSNHTDPSEFIDNNKDLVNERPFSVFVHVYDTQEISKNDYFTLDGSWENGGLSINPDLGYNGFIKYTSTTTDGWTKWKPNLPKAGYYKVSAFIPSNHGTTNKAVYEIYHNGISDFSAEMEQSKISDKWVVLGSYYFDSGKNGYVKLNSNTGESGLEIAADAMRFEYVDTPKILKIPSTIRVYRTSTKTIEVVDFKEYVKNVLPNKWIAEWDMDALKAGAMAAKTYGWYRIENEKYPGKCYDVKDTDQKYVPVSSHPRTDQAVDETWDYIMTKEDSILKENLIFESQYIDGTPGKPEVSEEYAGRMSIYGSKFLAEQGKDWKQILHYYYDPIEIKNNPSLDLIFLIDTTGSMGDDIANVKASANEIVYALDSKGYDYRIAIADYRDYPFDNYGGPEDYPYKLDLPFSNNPLSISWSIYGLNLGWGADWKESVYSALVAAMKDPCKENLCISSNYGWRKGVNKAIILIGDAPPHDKDPDSVDYDICPGGCTIEDVAYWSENIDPVIVYSIAIGSDPTTYSAFSEISERTGGKVYTSPTASDIVDTIIEVIGDIGDSLNLGVSLDVNPTLNVANPGESVTYSISITNTGTIADTYDISIDPQNIGGTYRGYPISIQESWTNLDRTSVEIEPDATETVSLIINVPNNWAGMEDIIYPFDVNAESEADDSISNVSSAELKVKANKRSMAEYSRLETIWLSELIQSSSIDDEIKNSLLDKLTNATKKLDQSILNIESGKYKQANNMLVTSQNIINAFISQVEAQYDKKIMQPDAEMLMEEANTILQDIESAKNM